MPKSGDSGQTRLPAQTVHAITIILALAVVMTSVRAYAAGPKPAQAQDMHDDRRPSDMPDDVSEKFVPAAVKFAPCPEAPGAAGVECGKLVVPVDYDRPHGESVSIAVIRVKATDPGKRIGALFANPGGPALSGIDFILAGLQTPTFRIVRECFDIISFDVRGSHRSRTVRCEVEPAGVPVDLEDAALAQFFDDFGRRVAGACIEQNGAFITSLSTNNIARDMDALRRALGERQISYVGISYGTALGAVYASLFPRRVRAMALDAAMAPEFRDSLVEFWAEHSAAFELAFRRLDNACRRDPACRLRETGVVSAFDAVTARLKAEPVTYGDGALLTDIEARNVVGELLYFERQGWPLIVEALADALDGDYALFFQFAPTFSPAGEDGVPIALNTRTFRALTAIFCNDYGTRRPAAEYLPVDEAAGALQSRLYGRFFVAAGAGRCAAWPKADPPIIRNVKGRVSSPILLIGGDFDNATPLAWARSLARALGMEQSLIRYQGGGHGVVTRGDACIDSVTIPYLFDLTIPAKGFSCPAQPIQFGSPAAQKGIGGNQAIEELESDWLWKLSTTRIRKGN
ncbi:MAG TPA: alpha/beta hydrolase [Blastocatellia bacterium]